VSIIATTHLVSIIAITHLVSIIAITHKSLSGCGNHLVMET